MSELGDLFAPYFEKHQNEAEDPDEEWCLKHLPHIHEVRAAFNADDAGEDHRVAEGDDEREIRGY